jgi:hypothetical protein
VSVVLFSVLLLSVAVLLFCYRYSSLFACCQFFCYRSLSLFFC